PTTAVYHWLALMKSIGLLLTFVLLVHAQCGASCLAAGRSDTRSKMKTEIPAEQPSCHQHHPGPAAVPSEHPASSHQDKGGPCSEAQTLEFKSEISKCILHSSPLEFNEACLPETLSVRTDWHARPDIWRPPDATRFAPILRI